MEKTLFTGTEGAWYHDRLRHMYKNKPKCALLNKMNHMVGTCPACGLGRYTTSKRWQIRYMTVDRIYPLLCSAKSTLISNTPFARSLCKHLYTNAEFPLPLITYNTFVHVPAFIDLDNKRVIDFLPNTKRGNTLIHATNKILSDAGYKYIVFNGTTELFKSKQPDVKPQTLQLAIALEAMLRPEESVPWD